MIGISPEYFLDDMSSNEVVSVMKARSDVSKSDWERTRMQSFYSVVAFNGTKNFEKPSDLFPLPWDNREGNSKKLTQEELSRKHSNYLKQIRK